MILKLLNKQITEETTTLPQIPVKTRQKKAVHIEASVEQLFRPHNIQIQ